MSYIAPPAPADRLALIIEGLCQAVARRGGLGGLAGPFIILIWTRLRRLKARFARHAITPPAPSRPAAKRRTPSPRRSQPLPLPRRSAWLLRLVPEAASGASQLRHFLADPETASLLAAAPQLRRILRPLCRMLGVRPAQALRTPSSPAPASPAPDAAPSRPIPSRALPQAAPAAFPPVTFQPGAFPPLATPPPRSPRAVPPVPA